MPIEDLCVIKGLAEDPLNFINPEYKNCKSCNGYDTSCQDYLAFKDTRPKEKELEDAR